MRSINHRVVDIRCRVCYIPITDELVPLLHLEASQRKSVLEMLRVTTGLAVQDNHRLPQFICRSCLISIVQLFTLWKCLRYSTGTAEKQCGICSSQRSLTPSDQGVAGMMVNFLTDNLKNQPTKYLCELCLQRLSKAYRLKTTFLESEIAQREDLLHSWERMEFQKGRHLVDQLYAELLANPVDGELDPRKLHCSVCMLEYSLAEVSDSCQGCLLKFINYNPTDDEDTGAEVGDSKTPDTIEDRVEEKKPSAASVIKADESSTFFEVICQYEDGPFEKIQRNGPVCCGCNQFFLTERDLSAHRLAMHSDKGSSAEFQCDVCCLGFHDWSGLMLHKSKADNRIYYYCRECEQVLLSLQMLQRHKFSYHLSKELIEQAQGCYEKSLTAMHICCVKECRSQYYSSTDLIRHCDVAHPNEDVPVDTPVCPYCKKKYSTLYGLSKHLRRSFSMAKFSCSFEGCSFTCKSETRMIWHCSRQPHASSRLRVRHRNQRREAREGSQLHSERDRFFVVMDDIADNVNPYQKIQRKGPVCCGCNQFFVTEEELDEHRIMEHPTKAVDAKFSCKYCYAGFSMQAALVNHMMKLEQDIYYYCVACEQVLLTKQMLEQHNAVVHASDVPGSGKYATVITPRYECCVKSCSKLYETNAELVEHCESVHRQNSIVESTACPHCGKRFESASKLERHLDRSVAIERYLCNVDSCTFSTEYLDLMLRHCRDPHQPASGDDTKDGFTVIGNVDGGEIDILERQCELCCGCFRCFDCELSLLCHIEKEHVRQGNDAPWQCSRCNESFETKEACEEHEHYFQNRTNYYCKTCKCFLWSKVDMQRHVESVHGNRQLDELYEKMADTLFTCCGCDVAFQTRPALIEHRRDVHHAQSDDESSDAVCRFCNKQMENERQLAQHIRLYSSSEIFQCKMCSFQTKKVSTIRQHVSNCNPQLAADVSTEHLTVYRCCIDECDYVNSSYNEVILHSVREHFEKREENNLIFSGYPFACPVCCSGFDEENYCVNKYKAGIQCKSCMKYFNPKTFATHNTHCPPSSQADQSTLTNNQEVATETLPRAKTEIRRKLCPICGKQLSIYSMSAHMANHQNSRSWVCPRCPMRFNTNGLLIKHQRVHNIEKNFVCRFECGKSYKSNGDRSRHEKYAHMGVRPYSCGMCNASFVRMRDLQIHSRRHPKSGRKP